MAKLEELMRDAAVKGILRDCHTTVIDVNLCGSAAVELTDDDPAGKPIFLLPDRLREEMLEIVGSQCYFLVCACTTSGVLA